MLTHPIILNIPSIGLTFTIMTGNRYSGKNTTVMFFCFYHAEDNVPEVLCFALFDVTHDCI